MIRLLIGHALLAAWLLVQTAAMAESSAESATPLATQPEATAGVLGDWFRNREQRGRAALEQRQYGKAAELFADPYRQGIAHYRAGDYAAAEQAFRGAGQDRSADNSAYNLGNSLFQQQRYQEAVQAYDQVLANNPNHEDARFNRRLAQRLQQQQQQKQQGQTSDGQDSRQQQGSQNGAGQPPDQQPDQQQPEQQNQQQKPQQGDAQAPGTPEPQEQAQDATGQDQSGSQAETQPSPQPDRDAAEQQGKTAGQTSDGGDDQADDGQAESPGAVDGEAEGAEEMAAQRWLNRLEDNPRQLLKNQFRLREQQADVRQGAKPW